MRFRQDRAPIPVYVFEETPVAVGQLVRRRFVSRGLLLIVDFDDTLFPYVPATKHPRANADNRSRTSLFNHLGFFHDPSRMPAQAWLDLQMIEDAANRLLLQSNASRVVIVTLANRSWVESVLSTFMPTLLARLMQGGVQIVSAREDNPSINCPFAAKIRTFLRVHTREEAAVVVGDSPHEVEGGFQLRRFAQVTIVRFVKRPNVFEITRQLDFTRRTLALEPRYIVYR